MSIVPIFLFSMPRSGSTMLQKILWGNDDIASANEPMLLLPLLSTLQSEDVYAKYSHRAAVQHINDFIGFLPEGLEDYKASLREFVLGLYTKASQGKPYFLDKTPAYCIISSDIINLFPQGRFIFLFRNPLSILASHIATFGHPLHGHKIWLYEGFDSLYRSSKEESAIIIRYEDLVIKPREEIKRLCNYIGIKYSEKMFDAVLKIQIPFGKIGNPEPVNTEYRREYNNVTSESIEKWHKVLSRNPIRKAYAKRYLNWVGKDRLTSLGYDYEKLYCELGSLKTSYREIGSDIIDPLFGLISVLFDTPILKDKLKRLPDFQKIYAHR